MIVISPGLSELPEIGLRHYIEAIGTLPDIIACKLWSRVKTPEALGEELVGGNHSYFVLTTQYQQGLRTLLSHLQTKYTIVAEWLNYYLCNSQRDDLYLGEKIYYQPLAGFLLARLKLCQEVQPKVPELQDLFTSPAELWVKWIHSELWWELYQQFQEKKGEQGKREWYKLARQTAKLYELQHEGEGIARPQLLKPGTPIPAENREIAPALLALFLEDLCAFEARADPIFDRKHYKEYLKKQRAFHNAAHNSPHMQVCSVTSKGFGVTQKNTQVSTSRQRRKV